MFEHVPQESVLRASVLPLGTKAQQKARMDLLCRQGNVCKGPTDPENAQRKHPLCKWTSSVRCTHAVADCEILGGGR